MNAIDEMTDLEKVQAMEELWSSLTINNRMPEPPKWHASILTSRTKSIGEGETEYTSLSALKERGPRI